MDRFTRGFVAIVVLCTVVGIVTSCGRRESDDSDSSQREDPVSNAASQSGTPDPDAGSGTREIQPGPQAAQMQEPSISWPSGTGYLSEPQSRPESPHSVDNTSTKAEIVEVGGGQFLLGENTRMEYRESRPLLVFPGATITYLCKDPKTYEMKDYNGDPCTLVYGITVRVDSYGQFVAIDYKPE